MDTTTILFLVVFAVLIWLFVQNCKDEGFYVEPNTIAGGYTSSYNAPFELEGDGNAGNTGY